ncbi:MAG TPA: hypothetical protein VMW43_00355 [Bacteroidota bacterium]|nr:hypothetical protein [Bacteroidota bacterium]
MRVYLSGGMEYADGEGSRWRSELQSWLETHLGDSVFNPNVESDRFFEIHHPTVDFRTLKYSDTPRYRSIVRDLVEIDCREIAERTDYLICLWDEGAIRGAGTKGELTMARFFGKPVYFVTTYPLHDVPGWILGCITESFSSFDDLKKFLLRRKKS